MNHEDPVTETVEKGTSRIPSLAFMGFAVTAMAASAALVLTGRKQLGNFVGQWAPSILIMGLYNKIAKEVAVPKRERLNAGMSGGLTSAHAGV
jgi:limonene-1,2-epoxide hydrolase